METYLHYGFCPVGGYSHIYEAPDYRIHFARLVTKLERILTSETKNMEKEKKGGRGAQRRRDSPIGWRVCPIAESG